jgi:hypothetical protein
MARSDYRALCLAGRLRGRRGLTGSCGSLAFVRLIVERLVAVHRMRPQAEPRPASAVSGLAGPVPPPGRPSMRGSVTGAPVQLGCSTASTLPLLLPEVRAPPWRHAGADVADRAWHAVTGPTQRQAADASSRAPLCGCTSEGAVMGYTWMGRDDQVYKLTLDPAPSGGSAVGYVWPSDGSQHVLYVDSSGHVQELWSLKSAPHNWSRNDLVNATGAPRAPEAALPRMAMSGKATAAVAASMFCMSVRICTCASCGTVPAAGTTAI